ncbi:MAG: cytochrome c [Lentisphaeria bacterium]|nr:cytochrome c [Lentisphaeria bacterium]
MANFLWVLFGIIIIAISLGTISLKNQFIKELNREPYVSDSAAAAPTVSTDTAPAAATVSTDAATAVTTNSLAKPASYATCAACHGQNAEGMKPMNAPALAGQSDWYISTQLHHFKKGIRGKAPGDITGMQMQGMSVMLTDEQIKELSGYLSSLPATKVTKTVEGDIEKGKTLYQNCLACHGADGAGMVALKSPALTGQHDWYIENQLLGFKKEYRGYHEEDIQGKIMQGSAKMFIQTDQDAKDLAAYIMTLNEK